MSLAACLLLFTAPVQDPLEWTTQQLSALRPTRARLSSLAEDLGSYGFENAARACLRSLTDLGGPESEVKALERRISKAVEKYEAQPKTPDAKQLARSAVSAAAIAEELMAFADGLEPVAAALLASTAILLDGGQQHARALLGHERGPGGRWGTAAETRERSWRLSYLAALQAARDLQPAIERVEPEDPLLQSLAGPPVVALRSGVVGFEGRMPREYLASRLRHTLRAAAVSNWLATGKLEPHLSEYLMVWTWAGPDYERYLRAATARGNLSEESLKLNLGYSACLDAASHLRTGVRNSMVANSTDYDLSTLMRVDHALAPGTGEGEVADLRFAVNPAVPPWMYSAHLYLVGLSYFGDGWITPFDLGTDVPAAWKPRDAGESWWLDTGWPALHAWCWTVTRRGDAPGISALRALDDTDLTTNMRLFQGVSMLEWLYASRGAPQVWADAAQAAATGGSASGVWSDSSLSAFLRREPGEFDSAWLQWLDGRVSGFTDTSITELLTEVNVEDALAGTAVAAIRAARRDWGLEDTLQDGPASVGCREHARWLFESGLHADAWTATRRQDPAAELSTAEGLTAAINGMALELSPNAKLSEVRQRLEGSLLHRIGLQQPALPRIGAGSHQGMLVLDLQSWSNYWGYECTVPVKDAKGVPTRHTADVPSLVPGSAAGELGYPITLFRYPLEGDLPAEMQLLDDDDRAVEVFRIQPHEFLELDLFVRGSYAMVPLKPLQRGARHTAEFKIGSDTIRWSFTTEK